MICFQLSRVSAPTLTYGVLATFLFSLTQSPWKQETLLGNGNEMSHSQFSLVVINYCRPVAFATPPIFFFPVLQSNFSFCPTVRAVSFKQLVLVSGVITSPTSPNCQRASFLVNNPNECVGFTIWTNLFRHLSYIFNSRLFRFQFFAESPPRDSAPILTSGV